MQFDVEAAASLLAEARSTRRQVEPTGAPASADDAYAVQDAVGRRFGPIGGWKVGAKSRDQTPNAAPLFANLVQPSPAAWASNTLHMIGIEAELAFRLGRDVAARQEPVPSDEIWGSVASVHAAIEIVDTRLKDWDKADRLWVLADNQSNGGFVYDPRGVSVAAETIENPQVRLAVNGRTLVEQRGGNPAGDPRWLVEWLINHCAQRRGGLRAGAFVTTGSYTGMIFVEPGARVEAAFAGIGTVSVDFLFTTTLVQTPCGRMLLSCAGALQKQAF